jgi:hypothetical protein
MMASLYFAMGLVMVVASRNPFKHKAFVDFLIISNSLHAVVMFITAKNSFHIFLDAIPVGAMGILPLFFYPWKLRNFLIRDIPDGVEL